MAVVYARLFMSAYRFSGRSTLDTADQQPVAWASAILTVRGRAASLTDDSRPENRDLDRDRDRGGGADRAHLALRGRPCVSEPRSRKPCRLRNRFRARCVRLAVPYAYAFGFFLNLSGSALVRSGRRFSSCINTWSERRGRRAGEGPVAFRHESHFSVGGGLIAGDALARSPSGLIGYTHVAW